MSDAALHGLVALATTVALLTIAAWACGVLATIAVAFGRKPPAPGKLRCDDCRQEFDHFDVIETGSAALLCSCCFDRRAWRASR